MRGTCRPESVRAGVSRVVGLKPERVEAEVRRLLEDREQYRTMSRVCSPCGDGHAAEQIVAELRGPRSARLLTEWSLALERWRAEFGLVVFDTPPAAAMAESMVLAPLVDSTIVLARVDRTPRSLLAGVTGQIANAGGNLAGLVLTFVRLDTQRGVMPSDSGYWFNQNRAYHRKIAA